jgi:Transcriptional regulators
MATIKDIAEKAGVSATTVSNVLNNKKGRIGRDTRQRIWKIAQELSYEKNYQAYNLVKKNLEHKNISIGCIVSSGYNIFDNPFLAEVLNGIKKETGNSGIHLEYCVPIDLFDSPEEAERISRIPVWGLIFIEVANKSIIDLFKEVRNIVFISLSFKEVPGTLVYTNIEAATENVVKMLIEMGHKNIAFLGPTHISEKCLELRFKGYLKAFKDYGMTAPNSLIENIDFSMEQGKKGMARIVKNGHRFTAVFCSSDDIAIGCVKVLKKNGYDIPNDVSIIGFDNSYLVNKCRPNLSSVHLYKNELGELAVKLLKENICNGYDFNSKLEIPWKIIVRDSVKNIGKYDRR